MKKLLQSGILIFLLCSTACQKQPETPAYLEAADSSVEIKLDNAYYSLKDQFPDLYRQLWFDIAVPEPLKLYDRGDSDGVVRFADSSGKNLLTLETHFKEDPERCYEQYLHGISATLSDFNHLHVYEEEFLLNQKYSARRIDLKQNSGTDTRLISYWLITIEASPAQADFSHQSGVCIVSVESAAENIEAMLKILTTFRIRGE